MPYSPKKQTFYHFSVGEHDNGQQFEQLIFVDITLFFIEFFRWKKKKFQSKNLIHPSIDDYLLLKILRRTWQRPIKMLKILFCRGNMTKGNMAKGITVFDFSKTYLIKNKKEDLFRSNFSNLYFFLDKV